MRTWHKILYVPLVRLICSYYSLTHLLIYRKYVFFFFFSQSWAGYFGWNKRFCDVHNVLTISVWEIIVNILFILLYYHSYYYYYCYFIIKIIILHVLIGEYGSLSSNRTARGLIGFRSAVNPPTTLVVHVLSRFTPNYRTKLGQKKLFHPNHLLWYFFKQLLDTYLIFRGVYQSYRCSWNEKWKMLNISIVWRNIKILLLHF